VALPTRLVSRIRNRWKSGMKSESGSGDTPAACRSKNGSTPVTTSWEATVWPRWVAPGGGVAAGQRSICSTPWPSPEVVAVVDAVCSRSCRHSVPSAPANSTYQTVPTWPGSEIHEAYRSSRSKRWKPRWSSDCAAAIDSALPLVRNTWMIAVVKMTMRTLITPMVTSTSSSE
jgi:hypothetical protein